MSPLRPQRTPAAVLVAALLAFSSCAGPTLTASARTGPAPLARAGVTHEEHVVPGARGVELFTQSWRPQSPPRGAIVLVHGLKDHSDRYADLAQALVQRGYAVHAFDLRGHGHSGGDRVWVDQFDDYVSDLDSMVAQARTAEPGVPLFVFGHSMGGAIVTRWALARSPKVDGIILSGAALKTGPEVTPFLAGVTRTLSGVLPHAGVMELDDSKFSRDADVVAAIKSDPLVSDGKGPARTAAELLGAIEKNQAEMAKFSLPVLVLHGGADVVTNPDGSRELVAKAASTDKRLQIYDGAYHDLLHDLDRQKVTQDIGAWLDQHTPAGAAASAR